MELEAIVGTAISKLVKGGDLPVGTYSLDGTVVRVELSGEMRKLPGEWRTPTASIPMIAVMANFISAMGIQREQALEKLQVAMTAAIANGEKGQEYVEAFTRDYEKYEEKVRSTLAELPKVAVAGKTLTKGCKAEIFIEAGAGLEVTTAKVVEA
jgi:hypothetical protein